MKSDIIARTGLCALHLTAAWKHTERAIAKAKGEETLKHCAVRR